MTALALRAGDDGDLDAVMQVMAAAFAPCFGEAWTRSQCAGILPLKGVRLTIAEQAGRACGFALSRQLVDEAELLLLAVAPDAQRRGVGRALLDDFLSAAASDGARHVHLEVRADNDAVRFYRQAGFCHSGTRRNYYRGCDGELRDALTFSAETDTLAIASE